MMDNDLFIKYLSDLTKDRFALNALSIDEYSAFFETLLAQFSPHQCASMYLLGTDGCHLCDEVMTFMDRLGVDYDTLELATADDIIIDTLGLMIPILITPHTLLCYPFGVMDVMVLINHKKSSL